MAGGTYVCRIGGLWEKEIGGGSRGGVMVDLSGRGNGGGERVGDFVEDGFTMGTVEDEIMGDV